MSGQFFIALSRLTQAKPFQFLVFSLFQFCDMASDALWTLESPGPYIIIYILSKGLFLGVNLLLCFNYENEI